MTVITFKPEYFNNVTNGFDFIDTCGKSEYEEHLCLRLNRHTDGYCPIIHKSK